MRLREYRGLVRLEEINVLIDLDAYKLYKQSEAYERGLIKLIRSSRTINKPIAPQTSQGLTNLRKLQITAKEKTFA
jgi:hypothetical protein